MKIALSSRRFVAPFSGGVDVYADRLARAFRRMGHQTGFLAFDLEEAATGPEVVVGMDEHQGLPVWRFVLTSAGRLESTFPYAYHKEMGESIRAVLRKERPDLLLILSFYISTLAAVEAAKDLGIPVGHIATDFMPICRRSTLIRWDGRACETGESLKSCAACFVAHRPSGKLAARILNALPESALLRFAEGSGDGRGRGLTQPLNPYWKQISLMRDRLRLLQPLREMIDKVFAPTKYAADAMLASGFRPDQVRLLPFAVEGSSPQAQIRKTTADHCRFLFIGRLQPYKGAHILVQAFNRLADPRGATLDIYGVPDGYPSYVRDLEAEIGRSAQIHYHGGIDPADLHRAFAGADYFVIPSIWHENSPLILLDALQSKTPVIASDVGGLSDLIEEGQNGFLFPMGDPEGLSRLMARLIKEPMMWDPAQTGPGLPRIDDYAREILKHWQEPALLGRR
jgi:glycosyltransferase involved in cell wall biosynthesis